MDNHFETYRGYVMSDETDSNDHMNVQYYTKKFDMASGQFFARLGFNYKELSNNTLGIVYVESTIRYIREIFEDEPIHITSSVVALKGKVVTFKHELRSSVTDDVHAEGIMKWVMFDKNKRKAVPLPEQFASTIENLLS